MRISKTQIIVSLSLIAIVLLAGIFIYTRIDKKKAPVIIKETTTVNYASAVKVYIFYGETCPHCQDLHRYLNKLKESSEYGYKFVIEDFEVWSSEENKALMYKVAEKLEFNVTGVPFYVIGDQAFSGYSDSKEFDIKAAINNTYKHNDYDVMEELND